MAESRLAASSNVPFACTTHVSRDALADARVSFGPAPSITDVGDCLALAAGGRNLDRSAAGVPDVFPSAGSSRASADERPARPDVSCGAATLPVLSEAAVGAIEAFLSHGSAARARAVAADGVA